MQDRPHWLPYRARDGVVETFFGLTNSPQELARYLERAINWSQNTEKGSFRLLDSFMSDSLTRDLLTRIFSLTNPACPAKLLIADPSSDFAIARAKSIGQIAGKEVRIGICNILLSIAEVLRIELPDLDTLTFEDLVTLIHQHSRKISVELRFYSEAPSSPMYFFKDILISGRFCAGLSSSKLPWSMIVDDPHYQGDLYDVYRDEFERIWMKAREAPEQRAAIRSNLSQRSFDLGIVTATETEWKALSKLPGVIWKKLSDISEGGSIFYGAVFEQNGRRLSVVATHQTQPGMVCAAIATTKLLHMSRVNFLANVGICAAVPNRARIGSIVIANQVFDAQAGKIVGGKLQPNVDSIALDLTLLEMIKDSEDRYSVAAHDAFSHLRHPKTIDALHGKRTIYGKVATVSQVIADSEFARQIWGQSRHCVAIEMESYAIFRAAAEAKSERRPRTIFIKVAADFADGHKNDRYQDYCASVSAHFLLAFAMEHLAQ
jgi:nucleoside phosphorylase